MPAAAGVSADAMHDVSVEFLQVVEASCQEPETLPPHQALLELYRFRPHSWTHTWSLERHVSRAAVSLDDVVLLKNARTLAGASYRKVHVGRTMPAWSLQVCNLEHRRLNAKLHLHIRFTRDCIPRGLLPREGVAARRRDGCQRRLTHRAAVYGRRIGAYRRHTQHEHTMSRSGTLLFNDCLVHSISQSLSVSKYQLLAAHPSGKSPDQAGWWS